MCRVKPGRVMFEVDGVPHDLAKAAIALGSSKLPMATRFITREEA